MSNYTNDKYLIRNIFTDRYLNYINPNKIISTIDELFQFRNARSVIDILQNNINTQLYALNSEELDNYLLNKKFCLIDFNVLCAHRIDNFYVFPPVEVSFTKFTLNSGIIDESHFFILNDKLNSNYLYKATNVHYEHLIPLRNKYKLKQLNPQSESDVSNNIQEFLVDYKKDNNIDCFSLTSKIKINKFAYDWLKLENSSLPDLSLFTIYDLISEVCTLIRGDNKVKEKVIEQFNKNLIYSTTIQNNNNCFYHNQIQNNYCPLGQNTRIINSIIDLIERNWD